MKKNLLLIFSFYLFSLIIPQKSFAGIFVAITSSDWGTTSMWQKSSDGGLTFATATAKPGSADSVYIGGNGGFGAASALANATVTISGTQSCKYIRIYSGATLKSTTSNSTLNTFRVYATIQNDGTLGGSGYDGINLEQYGTNAMTITGSGTYYIGRLRSNPNSTAGAGITVDANMTITASSSCLTLYYNGSVNTTSDNVSLTINSGKTVSLTNPLGALHLGSSTTTNASGNYTYNINGTLDLSGCTGDTSYIIPLANSGTVTLNVAGTLKLANVSTVNTGTYSGSLAINNTGNIYIGGNLINNATIAGTGTTTFNGTAAQYISNNGTISKMVINNNNNVYINSTATLNITSSLNTNNQFVLLSTSSGSGSIGNTSGVTITGNVTVQRYIGTSQQWRMIGFPLVKTTTINASDLSTQYGTGYNAYVFDETKDDGANYGNSGTVNAGWQQFNGTATAKASQGILMLGGSPSSILNATGTLNTGNISYTGHKTVQGWTFVDNPYACNLDWSHFYNTTNGGFSSATTVSPTYYIYDPGSTAYVSYNALTSTPSNIALINNVIPNGAAFFLQVLTDGTPITISESDKTTATPAAMLFGSSNAPQRGSITLDGAGTSTSSPSDKSIIRLNLKQQGDVYGSEAVVLWGGGVPATDLFDAKYDAYDLGRMKGADLAVVDAKGTTYSIFHGSDLKSSDIENREVALKISQLTEGTYTLNATIESPIANGNQVSIYDHYLNQYTLLDNSSKTYTFSVTNDAASQASGRFSLVMNAKDETATAGSSNISLLNNPSTTNSFTLYSQANFNTVQWNLVDGNGNNVGAGQLNNLQKGATYKVNTPAIASGLYFIKLVGDNKKLNTLKLMKQ